jgi:hypothetical protein
MAFEKRYEVEEPFTMDRVPRKAYDQVRGELVSVIEGMGDTSVKSSGVGSLMKRHNLLSRWLAHVEGFSLVDDRDSPPERYLDRKR